MGKRTMTFNFEVKKRKGSSEISIEGLANANTVDRMKERILPSAWNLENYKKNPVVLFDHGHDPTFGFMPIGKAVEVEAKEEGLYTKIILSNSQTEKIKAIRDLVEEGILKTFSVGFDPKSTAKADDNPDVMEITKAELIETSIVPIPMNQDSTFTMLGARKAYWHTPIAKRWYDTFMDRVELHKKKAWVAAAVHQRLFDLIEVGEIRSKDAALKFIADEAETTIAQVHKAMSGKLLPVPAQMVKAFAGVLRVDVKTLEALNKGDVALLERVMTRAEKEDDMSGKKKPAAKGGKKKTKKAKAAKAAGKICFIAVPKDAAEDLAAATAKVEAAGFAVDQPEETDQAYVFWQIPKDEYDSSVEGLLVDMGDGVQAHVIPSGEAAASGEADDGKAMDDEYEDDKKDDEKADDTDEEADPNEEETDPEESDEEAVEPQELVAAALAALEAGNGEEVKILLEKLAALGDALAAKSLKNVDGTDDNPYIKAAQAQTAMLGAILNELKGMGEGMKGLADLTVALSKAAGDAKGDAEDDDTEDEGKDGEEAKSLDLLRNYQRDLDKRLKNLKV